MDRVSLHGIDVYAYHGVAPEERELGQRFVVDVDLWLDCTPAALRDDLSRAADYGVVYRLVCDVAQGMAYKLIETVAGQLCRGLLADLPVERVRVCVQKVHPPLPGFRGVASVTLERDRSWLKTEFVAGGDHEE